MKIRQATPVRPLPTCLLLTVAVACASAPPPLDPGQAAIAARAQGIAASSAQYERVEGRWQGGGDRSAYAAYFADNAPVMIDESTRTSAGVPSRRAYYWQAGKLFYVEEQTALGADPVEVQLFYEDGRSLGSRKLAAGKLAALDPGEADALTARASALLGAAQKQRGPAYKIELDMSRFDDLGLVGPPLRAVRYAFCIPASEAKAEEVRAIDKTVVIGGDAAGGRGCPAGQERAVGTTHQPAFRKVLMQLAELPYVEHIQEATAP